MIALKFKGKEYQFKLTYRKMLEDLPNKFNIHLGKIFTDNDLMQQTMLNLLVEDEVSIKLFHWAINSASLTYEDLLDDMDQKTLSDFRDCFWEEVVNFSDPLRKEASRALWEEYKKVIQKSLLEGTEKMTKMITDS